MSAYLLDTNILSDIAKDPSGRAAQEHQRLTEDPETDVFTSIIVACELRFGVIKKGSARLAARVDEQLAGIRIAPLSAGADDAYAALRTDLERRGQPIGQNDMLIAAHALALDAILVTDNVREFKRVKGLRLENWMRPGR
jgi:tRNA(fMet)-specific endonuclease VapC